MPDTPATDNPAPETAHEPSAVADNTVVWTEIPVRDLERAKAFYGALLGMELATTEMEPNPIVMLTDGNGMGVSGHLYPGEPAAQGQGPTIHFKSPGPLEASMDRVWEAGGKVLSEVISIPDGSFFYCQDPDGNSFGVFTYAA